MEICLEALRADIGRILLEIQRHRAVFEHTTGLRQLFLAWGRILDDIAFMGTGHLLSPSTVEDMSPREMWAQTSLLKLR